MKCTFNLKNVKNKDNKTLIYLKAYFKNEGKRFVYSTGETIRPSEWDFKNRLPNNFNGRGHKADNHRSIKMQLDRYSNFFLTITNQYKNTHQEITIEKIRTEFDKEFKKVSIKKNKFFEAYDDFIEYKKKNNEWSKATIKRYSNIKNILLSFEEVKNYKLNFNSINDNFYTEFTNFCMNDLGHINNTFSRNVGLLKTFLFWSLNKGYTYKTDFMSFKKKPKVITNQVALTKEDIEKLLTQNYDTKRLERVRDIFVFACVTGVRFGELKLISKSNIIKDTLLLKEEKGTRKETREIPLNEIALYLLHKYEYKFPLIANQKYNDYLKEIFKLAGYTYLVEKTTTRGKEVIREEMPFYKRIASHSARRTFITMMKRNGKSDKLISQISGHSDMKTLNQYYQVSNDEKKEAIKDTFNIQIPLKKVN
ncbi:site-specific integrase [Flavobacteriaceae bacterium F08102]|nr:site-specific integrase [Flavobacteriaceae bacterium F08102]